MVGMGVRFQHIDDVETLTCRRREQRISGSCCYATITRREIEDGVNNRGFFRGGVVDNIADGVGRMIEKSLDGRMHESSPSSFILALAKLD